MDEHENCKLELEELKEDLEQRIAELEAERDSLKRSVDTLTKQWAKYCPECQKVLPLCECEMEELRDSLEQLEAAAGKVVGHWYEDFGQGYWNTATADAMDQLRKLLPSPPIDNLDDPLASPAKK